MHMHMRFPRHLLALALAALSATASAGTLPSGADCAEIPGAGQALSAGRIVMVGEIHGTNEMPAAFVRLVCGALQRGQTVSVGLEMFDPDGALGAYMTSDGDAAARRALLAQRHWNGMRDGRSSEAWLGMIETFWTWRRGGLPLSVFALNDRSFAGGYDQVMAARLRQEHTAHPQALLLTYTGNVHSMLERPAGLPAPTGTLVADLAPVSIELTSEAGQAWLCSGPGECGAHDFPAMPGNGPRHAAQASARAGAYTLQINVGRITASPPAVPVPASK
jgi:hypothetical protein